MRFSPQRDGVLAQKSPVCKSRMIYDGPLVVSVYVPSADPELVRGCTEGYSESLFV